MTDIELYNSAKEAYYNGTPIMEDFEFDELEKSLGLDNKSYVGTRHNPSYTVKHPFIMGSLSKIQIKKSEDGSINWGKYTDELRKAVLGNHNYKMCIITPKYDGCSFEVDVDPMTEQMTISSRGDGEYGKDLYKHLKNKVIPDIDAINNTYTGRMCLRGEVLINKSIFASKYSDYVNPRSFVSGILNRDYDANDTQFIEMLNDLSIVIYDIRLYDPEAMTWNDVDWDRFDYPDKPKFSMHKQFGYGGYHPSTTSLEDIYDKFAEYRENCEYALDGIVIKPIDEVRINNLTEPRPTDCIAIKFVPMLEETEIVDIVWSTRKTNELIPVIIVKPVIMDGKTVTKASAHNWGYCIQNGINIGAKVILSLAGDIIPFIYKVTKPSDNLELLNTVDYDRSELEIHDCHLMKVLTTEELNEKRFINSVAALNIDGMGESNAYKLYNYLVENSGADEFFGIEAKPVPDNILLINSNDIDNALGGKTGKNVSKSFVDILKKLTLKDVIKTLCIEDCGGKIAEQIENYFVNPDTADFSHLASKAYEWIYDTNSESYIRMMNVLDALHMSFDDFKAAASKKNEAKSNQIPVILTGEPNDYSSKADFLNCHPEYRNTTSWKEVQIVFTNSLESNTGKMKKAREKNIEIKLY